MPANSTEKRPENRPHFAAQFDGEDWQYVPDYRGEIYYSTQTGEQIVISEIGAIPKDFTAQKPLNEPCSWDGQKWVKDEEKLTALLAEQRAEMWECIKQKRHNNLRGGVYVKSIGKWFHSNDESRQQYTFLRTLDALPPNLMWKTMDNSFVQVTKAVLDELSLQLVLDEQADFTNAERHKTLMEQAENPLDYDFSDGWTDTFSEVINE
ncbi:DUF4376 domain-containing protein [Rodentibacter pneumotropicus]|uniref:DUF4376 domain-containing protein n=2 Tax=Rodentibacter pneumotropicus TaxID=758 RepID=A0A4S2Q232_9PAST|nr:DUF4376 domain-containing protein [Rodentibacter pneumotropicus]